VAAHQRQHEKWDAFVVTIARAAEVADRELPEKPELTI
jgi:hypothetical protein